MFPILYLPEPTVLHQSIVTTPDSNASTVSPRYVFLGIIHSVIVSLMKMLTKSGRSFTTLVRQIRKVYQQNFDRNLV